MVRSSLLLISENGVQNTTSGIPSNFVRRSAKTVRRSSSSCNNKHHPSLFSTPRSKLRRAKRRRGNNNIFDSLWDGLRFESCARILCLLTSTWFVAKVWTAVVSSRFFASDHEKRSFFATYDGGTERGGTSSRLRRRRGGGAFGRGIVDPVFVNEEDEDRVLRTMRSSYGGDVHGSDSWPPSVRNEEGTFQPIVHPADKEVTLDVPRFFASSSSSSSFGNGKLITPSIASAIGSYATESGWRSKSADERTIFVSIVSYRDWRCRYTVESLFERAKHPERIRVGIVDQFEDGLDQSCDSPLRDCEVDPEQAFCKYRDRIDVYEMEASLAVGPIFARHIGQRLYRGEYYALQINAHVTFVADWDSDIVQQFESTRNEMAVLTTRLTDVEGSIDKRTGESLRLTRPIMCNADFDGTGHERHLRHLSQPEASARITGSPQLEPFWAAGFSFSRGHFIMAVPYDPYLPMAFRGEEISVGLRAFTFGYDFYAPERSVCFNSYDEDEKNDDAKSFLEHASLYPGAEQASMARLLGIIHMNPEVGMFSWRHDEENKYGVGSVRDLSKFFTTFGIHVQLKRAEQHLCNFVASGQMHNSFVPFLREDNMGIDYNKIKFRFHELSAI